MWPFSKIKALEKEIKDAFLRESNLLKKYNMLKAAYEEGSHRIGELVFEHNSLKKLSALRWLPLDVIPPANHFILVANKDFTYYGIIYYEDGWDYSRKLTMYGTKDVFLTYTNSQSIAWWLNLDDIKKEENGQG